MYSHRFVILHAGSVVLSPIEHGLWLYFTISDGDTYSSVQMSMDYRGDGMKRKETSFRHPLSFGVLFLLADFVALVVVDDNFCLRFLSRTIWLSTSLFLLSFDFLRGINLDVGESLNSLPYLSEYGKTCVLYFLPFSSNDWVRLNGSKTKVTRWNLIPVWSRMEICVVNSLSIGRRATVLMYKHGLVPMIWLTLPPYIPDFTLLWWQPLLTTNN